MLALEEGCMCGESMGRCIELDGGPRVLGGMGWGGPMPGIMGLDRGLLGPVVWGGRR